MKDIREINEKWFIIPIVGLLVCLVLKLIQTAIDFLNYPFHSIADLSDRLLYLFFFTKYGFHQQVPDAFHTLILFKDYPPLWYYFNLPFFYITNSLLGSIFISLIATIIIGFIFVYFFNRKLSLIKKIAFFTFFFGNPLMLDYLQIGRYPEILAWVIFIPFFYYSILYTKKKIDLKFFLIIIPLFSLILLTQMYVAVISTIFFFSVFLVKEWKERLFVVLGFLSSMFLTSFWWIPFLFFIRSHLMPSLAKVQGAINSVEELLNLSSVISYNTLFILALFVLFFFYVKQLLSENRKILILFWIPPLALCFLMITRLIVFVPVFKSVPLGPYDIFISFIMIYLFFQLDFKRINYSQKLLPLFLVLLVIGSIFISYSHNKPFFKSHNELSSEIVSFVPFLQENFFVFEEKNRISITDYAKINYGLSSPGRYPGRSPLEEEVKLMKPFIEKDCKGLREAVRSVGIYNLISYDEGCDFIESCGFNKEIQKERACLFKSFN